VFDRYTEKARRVIFFARYEASVFGSPHIETEHLLLGLMREDSGLKARLGSMAAEEFRKEVEEYSPPRQKISTSVDLPLSHECKRALTYAAEESEALNQKFIGPGHLVLGLLRIDGTLAATFLIKRGVNQGNYREIMRTTPADPPERMPVPSTEPAEPQESRPPKAAALADPIATLNLLLDREIAQLDPDQRLKRKPWSRKEAMGHLVDLAAAHHQWLARGLVEPRIGAAVYPQEEWVAAQQYADYGWRELVSLWLLLNRLVIHVLTVIPEEKLNTSCRIGVDEPRTLREVVRRYVAECEDLVGQIMAKLE